MALKGNLRDFSVTQLLNLINLARKTGTLTIEGPTEAAWVSFRDGKLIYAQLGNEDGTLVGILLRGGLVSARQARAIKTHASDKNDKELGLLLINAGYLVQQSILASIRQYFLDIVYLPPEGRITIRLNLENIIIEGARRMREWEKLKDEVPNLEMALDFVERPGANIRDVNLNVEEWKVVSYVNPKNTIAQIAKANQMNDLEIRRVVYGLLHAGLVEVVRPDGMPIPARVKQFKPIDEGQRVSLVNRLIQRIRSL